MTDRKREEEILVGKIEAKDPATHPKAPLLAAACASSVNTPTNKAEIPLGFLEEFAPVVDSETIQIELTQGEFDLIVDHLAEAPIVKEWLRVANDLKACEGQTGGTQVELTSREFNFIRSLRALNPSLSPASIAEGTMNSLEPSRELKQRLAVSEAQGALKERERVLSLLLERDRNRFPSLDLDDKQKLETLLRDLVEPS